jgi:glycosyltransferase involved in cell wall biosynthesis
MDMARINQRIDELEELINLLKQDRISEIAEKCTYGSLSAGQSRAKASPPIRDFLDEVSTYLKRIPDSNGSRYFEKGKVRIGIICDEFLFNLYKDCAVVAYITPENYKDFLGCLDILLTVTTWKGFKNSWYGLGNKSKNNPLRKTLYSIIDEFRESGTKIVFYSKEDPVNYDRFIDIAKRCEYIFTTAIEKIQDYKKDCINKNVFLLKFGVNPIYHNPICCQSFKLQDSVLFSGSWNDVHADRCKYMDYMFKEIINSTRSFTIIDRNSETGDNRFLYPFEYEPYTYKSVEHNELQKVHKLFDWAMNISTITGSQTMTANRVYELQALANLMISNYAIAINNDHPTVFTCIEEANDIKTILNAYSEEEIYMLQMHGLRNVMSKHTVYHRLKELLEPLGLIQNTNVQHDRKIAVIINEMTPEVKASLECQTYQNIKVIRAEEVTKDKIEDCDMIAFFNSKYQYEEFYLEDMVNAFKYTDCDYITKDAYKLNGSPVKGIEHNYVGIMKDKCKTVFWKDSFDLSTLLDMQGEQEIENGYSIDHFELNVGTRINASNTILPKFSVIIPVYNNGDHLYGKAFMSLRRSSMFDSMEIILVDDGSTDGYTPKIVNRLGRQYANVKTCFFEEGGSGSASRPRNKGLEMSTTDYITYLDPDNEAINDGYAKLYQEIIKNDVDMVIGKMLKITNKVLDFKFRRYGIIEDPKQELIQDNFSMQSLQALMIKKSVMIDNALLQIPGALGQDKLIYFEMLFCCKRILRIDQPIHYYYGAVEGSVTNMLGKRFFEKSYLIEVATVKSFIKNGVLEDFLNSKFEIFFENGYLEKFKQIKVNEAKECIDILLSIYELYEKEAVYSFKKENNRRFIKLAKAKDYETIIYEYIPRLKTKILFAGHDFKFLSLIIDRFEKNPKFDVRLDTWSGHNNHDETKSKECLDWADIIICEWGLGNAVWYSKNKLPHQKLFVRMHLQERDLPYISEFNMDNIDKIIAITPYMREVFNKNCGVPLEKMVMIYNYIDTTRLDLPKYENARFNIGLMGILPKRKRLDLAIDIIEKLYEKDQRYRLYIKGHMPQNMKWLWGRKDERLYYIEQFERIKQSKAKDNIIFEDFSPDIENWFRKIGFMLSTSDFEGSHQAPMEGASTGAYPVVRNWAGSDTVYPKEVIFDEVDDMVNFILNPSVDISYIKKFTKQFDIDVIYNQFERLIGTKKELE